MRIGELARLSGATGDAALLRRPRVALAPVTNRQRLPELHPRDALDKTQRPRQQALLATVRQTVVAKQELPDGLALSFPGDAATFLQLAEWISLERRCCPFLAFALEWKQDDSVLVRLTGQPGGAEAVAAEMGIIFEK